MSKTRPTSTPVHGAADRYVPSLSLLIAHAVGKARATVSLSALQEACQKRDQGAVVRMVDEALAAYAEALQGPPAPQKAASRTVTLADVLLEVTVAGANAIPLCVPEDGGG